MNLKEIKHRIQSVKNTQKITSAMKLVSSAKLRRAQTAIEGMSHYSNKLNGLLASFLSGTTDLSIALTARRECRSVVVIAVSSDTGLCGTFNANVTHLLSSVLDRYRMSGATTEVYTVGKKICAAVKKMGYNPVEELMQQSSSPQYDGIAKVSRDLMKRFCDGDIDRVDIVYSHFRSAAKQEPVCEMLLPVDFEYADNATPRVDYIVEPGRDEVLAELVPKVVEVRLFTALLDAVAAEYTVHHRCVNQCHDG